MKSLIALSFVVMIFAASCHAPSGHRNQSWHPSTPKKAKQGHNR